MNSDSICPQFLNNNSASLMSSEEKEAHNTLEATKQHLSAEVIREEGSLVSNSTTNSVMQNQSNATSSHGDDDESCSSPSSEKKQKSLEDSKPIEAPSAWGKPLKKVTKVEENTGNIGGSNTAVIKVVKPGPPPKKDLRQAFYDTWRGYDRTISKNQQLYKSSLTILPSKTANSQKTLKEPLLPLTGVYKQALTTDEITEKQLQNELSRKLYCSASGTSIFDASKLNLGYPVYLETDIFKRFRPMPIMKLLSYKAFFNSPSRVEGDHWIPAYINEAHFNRNYDDIMDAIALIYQDIEGKDAPENFQPFMILKVLPTLLVKTTINFSKRNITQSKDSIDTFCQLYRLFVKLVELFPEVKEAINEEVKNFSSRESSRHQSVQEDLGEFLIKLSVSTEGINNSEIINLVLQEHLARQALFSLKRERDLGKGQHECDKFLETYMDSISMSNEVFLSTIEMCRLFADKDVNSDLEARQGVLNKAVRRVFLNRLSWIRRNVGYDWKALIGMLQLESYVANEQVMASYVVKSFETAKANGYFD